MSLRCKFVLIYIENIDVSYYFFDVYAIGECLSASHLYMHPQCNNYLILKAIVLRMYVLAIIMPGKGHCGKNVIVVRCIFVSLIVSYTYVAATYVKGNMDKYPHFIIYNRMYVLVKSLEKTHKAIKLLSYYICRLQYLNL